MGWVVAGSLKGPQGEPGQPGEPGQSGVVDHVGLDVLDSPSLDTDLLVVDRTTRSEGEVKVTAWSAFKARIAGWLESLEATWSNKTLVEPTVTGVITVDGIAGGNAVGNLKIFNGVGVSPFAIGASDLAAEGSDLVGSSASGLLLSTMGAASTRHVVVLTKGTGRLELRSDTGEPARLTAATNNGGTGALAITAAGGVTIGNVPVVTTTGVQPINSKTLTNCTLSTGTTLDGSAIAVKVAVPATATSPGKPGQFAADATHLYVYTGNGTTHTWRRTATETW